jgi:oxygen-independent coproporphyrinogen-3 oxidase
MNEYIMTSVRTIEGLDIERIDPIARAPIIATCEKFISRGWMRNEDGRFVLTREGKLFADGIAAELFI